MKTEYRIVQDDSVAKVEQTVNALLARGWMCKGGITVAATTEKRYNQFNDFVDVTFVTFMQAMVK